MREPWISDESSMTMVARRAAVRGLRRPALVIAVPLLAACAYVAYRAIKPPAYEATLYFRLAEGGLGDPGHAPQPPHDVREYITSAVLSRFRLEQIMRKHGRSSAWLERDRVAAIDDFRDEIGIDVSRNYFLYDRGSDDPPRSAQVTLSLIGTDAEQTRALLHDVGDAILQEQAAQRNDQLVRTREVLDAQLARARARVRSLQELAGRGAVLGALQVEARGAIEQLMALERRRAQVALSAAAEGEQLGMTFELFDEDLVTVSQRPTSFGLALRGAAVFAIALLLTVPAVGAFDDRIFGEEDLAARGLRTFGAIPRFPGDDTGSYRARVSPHRA